MNHHPDGFAVPGGAHVTWFDDLTKLAEMFKVSQETSFPERFEASTLTYKQILKKHVLYPTTDTHLPTTNS